LPEWKFNKKIKKIVLVCPNCHFYTAGFDNRPAAIAYWFSCNRQGNDHLLMLWKELYEKQSNKNGTAVPLEKGN